MKGYTLKEHSCRPKAWVLLVFCVYIFFVFLCASPYAYAEGFSGSDMNSAARILQTLTLSGGAVAIAFCGIRMAYGSQQEAEKARNTIIGIVIATGAIFALPYVIQATKAWAAQNAWSPSRIKGG